MLYKCRAVAYKWCVSKVSFQMGKNQAGNGKDSMTEISPMYENHARFPFPFHKIDQYKLSPNDTIPKSTASILRQER